MENISPRVGIWLLLGVAVVAGFGFEAYAQTVEGVEAGRLRDAAKVQEPDARVFADEVRCRGEALREEALASRAAANANRLRAPAAPDKAPSAKAGVFDFDQLVADAQSARAGPVKNAGPRFIAFASMAMPVNSLRAMIRDVGKAGGIVVFRGFQNNSVKAFSAAMLKVVDKGQATQGIGIDPRLFRAFAVTAVPAYVVTSTDLDLCDGFACTTALPPHDRIAGNVTAAYALESFAAGRGPGAAASKVFLGRLGKTKPS
jgi:conjugal transfer pilus assembly protein TrbC